MIVGIIGNTLKSNFQKVLTELIEALHEAEIHAVICDKLQDFIDPRQTNFPMLTISDLKSVGKDCDLIISVGGDGTMLATAATAYEFNKPIVGVNLGKLGFLAEISIEKIKEFTNHLRSNAFTIEERMVLNGTVFGNETIYMTAFNDFVIDKGGWPKMIEITISVGEEYVTTFAADGLIIATPTGSTGYSLSTGGPIVSPQANVITLSPISAHSLTMRPLVIDAHKKITVEVHSQHNVIQINNDGRRENIFTPPLKMEICKNPKSLKLLRTASASYFSTLRNKLLWGLDVRKFLENRSDLN